jgi:hypothetical protein
MDGVVNCSRDDGYRSISETSLLMRRAAFGLGQFQIPLKTSETALVGEEVAS